LLDKEIPSLCIQPLAENAVYHGIEPLPEGGKILISALQVDNKLKISVSNPLMPETQKSKKGNQMAQDNIKQRLKLVYGDNGEFSIIETKESYTVTLSIPLT
jgi:two-component system sensor histidine kinase AlgZ